MTISRIHRVQQDGEDPIAYSTLQHNMRYFDTPLGYVAYRAALGMNITLGPPVCAPQDRSTLLDMFIAQVKHPLICYIREDVVRDLGHSRLYCASMGVDREADIDSLLATPPRPLVGAIKQADKAGFHLSPLCVDEAGSTSATRLRSISAQYLAHAKCNTEMSFLNSPMSYHNDGMRRLFALNVTRSGRSFMLGYVALNPVYSEGSVQGYLLDVVRFEPTRLWGVWYSTVWHLARLLKTEHKRLWLGFCPLAETSPALVRSSRWMDTQVRWLARYCGSVHYIQRLHTMKATIPGWYESRYFASHTRTVPWALVALVSACGVGADSLISRELVRSIATGFVTRPRGSAT